MTSEDTFPLTELASMTSRTQKSFPLNENDKIIFDELKELTLSDDWEAFLSNLLEFDEFPIDFQDRDGFTLLHHAAFNKSIGCLRVLMEDFFAAPNIKADTGYTPIHLLVSLDCRCMPCMEKILNCLQILIDGGAEVDEEDDLGETPLYSAARNRLSQPAGFLLSHGANINHWVNGTSVATLLAQYVPDVLEIEFDKCITSDVKKGAYRSLRLDFRLLLQKVAVDQGLVVLNSPVVERKNKMLSHRRAETSLRGSQGKMRKEKGESYGFLNTKDGNEKQREGSSSTVSSTSTQFSSAIQPKETELLNYLLKADFAAIEAVVNHPLVEAFVYLKWLSVRNLFFLLRSSYLFLISLYTFYVFDTFVDATCFYPSNSTSQQHNDLPTVSGPHQMKVEGRADDNSTAVKATFGLFIPRGASGTNESRKYYNFYYWHSFAEYFKAHEMTCEPSLRTQIMAYIFSTFVVILVLYELYKLFDDGWRDYFKSPLNLAWWILAVNTGFTVVPGLGIYAHSWHYPYAAFSLVYGWILVLAQLWRMPYFGILVGVFVKVLKDFILLLLTFSPVLLAFALGFSVMLPQNEFFRSIPAAIFKVFLMMTGDVDFLGVFRGIWTTRQGHVYIPVFIIYSLYILTVTMVLMSLLLGLAVDNIQEVRHEAALHRTVTLIKEIGIFESILHQPSVYYCGLAKYLRRMFSITSLKCMNGPELITFPENSEDTALPPEIKQKLVRYLTASCCCSETIEHPSYHDISSNKRKGKRYLERIQAKTQGNVLTRNKNRGKSAKVLSALEVSMGQGADDKKKSRDIIRREFFERQVSPKTPAATSTPTTAESGSPNLLGNQQLTQQLLQKDLELYNEVKELLEDNDRLKRRLESLKEKLLRRK